MSKEIEEILEECLHRLKEGEDIEDCLSHYPERAEELRPLLYTAIRIGKAFSRIQPHPHFRARLKYRLLSLPQRKTLPLWKTRWAFALLSILILFILGGGTVWASAGSLPDHPLYPVKLATERVQLAFSPSPSAKAMLQAKLIDKRIEEIQRMMGREMPMMPKYVEKTEERLMGHLQKIHTLAPHLKKEEKVKLRGFLMTKMAQHQKIMAEMMSVPLPAPPKSEIRPTPPRIRDWWKEYEKTIEILKE